MMPYFYKALKAQLSQDLICTEAGVQLYNYYPLDQRVPYIAMQMDHAENNELIQYAAIDIHLVTRETGVVQTAQLAAALKNILDKAMYFEQDKLKLTFIVKIAQVKCTLAADCLTKTYTYSGRFKMKGES